MADGLHSQLIEINTKQYAASEPDRFAGIYQTVALTKGAAYTLKMQGGMREHQPNPAEDKFRYRVQWGYTTDGSTDWTKVTNWVELPWDKIDERTAPTGLQSFATTFAAPSSQDHAVYPGVEEMGQRVQGTRRQHRRGEPDGPGREAAGAAGEPGRRPARPGRAAGARAACSQARRAAGRWSAAAPSCCRTAISRAASSTASARTGPRFNNGGAAAYGFYDEMWTPVIKDGAHGQLIEINTWGLAASQPDRFAGIYQVVGGLTAGATYEISAWGMLREEAAHPTEDKFRYRVQWGYAPADADPSEADITNWTELPWDNIYVRTAPGSMSSFSARFTAPAGKTVVAFRAWKKWGTAQRELNVNLDAIKLVACSTSGGVR